MTWRVWLLMTSNDPTGNKPTSIYHPEKIAGIEVEPIDTPTYSTDLWTIPNIISMVRLGLAVVVFLLIDMGGMWITTAILFVVAVTTDAIDGYIARAWDMRSVLGRILDPTVDKIIVGGAFIFLQNVEGTGICPWITTAIIGREILISAIRGYIEQMGIDFSAKWSGKAKMVLQSIAVPFCMLAVHPEYSEWRTMLILRDVFLYSAVIATIYSGVEYLWRALRLITAKPPEEVLGNDVASEDPDNSTQSP